MATIDADGDYVVVWQTSSTEVRAQRYKSDGTAVGSQLDVSEGYGRHPAVAMDDDGDFGITWIGPLDYIHARTYSASGDEITDILDVDSGIMKATPPDIAMDADGDFVVTWVEYHESLYWEEVYARHYSLDASTSSDVFRVDDGGELLRHNVAVSMTDEGRYVIVWGQGDDNRFTSIYGRIYESPADDLMALPFAIHEGQDIHDRDDPDVVVDEDGRYAVTWIDNGDVIARRMSLSDLSGANPLSDEIVVGSFDSFAASYPVIAGSEVGEFVVGYVLMARVRVASFDSANTPAPIGGTLTVHEDDLTYPAIGADAAGDFVVTYYQSLDGVFQRRYSDSSVVEVIASGTATSHVPYPIPDGSGEQLRTVPVGGFNRVSTRFARPVDVVSGDLLISGVKQASYGIVSFNYEASTFTASWVFSVPVGQSDRITLELSDDVATGWTQPLDGEWDNPTAIGDGSSSLFPSGNGTPGGNFVFEVTRLPGDGNRDNVVDGGDFTLLGGATFTTGDFNGSGGYDGGDFTIWSDNFGENWSSMIQFEARSTGRFARLAKGPDASVRQPLFEPLQSPAVAAIIERSRRAAFERAFEDLTLPTEPSRRIARNADEAVWWMRIT